MEKQSRLAELVKTVVELEHNVVNGDNVYAEAAGFEEPVVEEAVAGILVVSVAHISIGFKIHAEGDLVIDLAFEMGVEIAG